MNRFDERFPVKFGETDNLSFSANLGEIQLVEKPDTKYYDGEYTVTPKPDAQVLETAQKKMAEDVKIKAIPFFDVKNQSGGKTIYIGEEV